MPCPVCESNSFHELFSPRVHVDDPDKLYGAASGIQGTQRIVRCDSCDMIFENPRLPQDLILKGYENAIESGHDSQYPMRVLSFQKALEKLSSCLPPKGCKVLDIGTAGGAFLHAASNYGYDVYGLEPSLYLVQQGKDRGLNIFHGTIEQNTLTPASFDLICLWDVIEHLVDPKSSLDKIKRFLKPGGTLLINYPYVDSFAAKILKDRYWWMLSVHLHHFSKATMKDICDRAGYTVIKQRPYWQVLEFGYLVDVARKLNVPTAGLVAKMLPAWIKKIPLPYFACQRTAIAKVK